MKPTGNALYTWVVANDVLYTTTGDTHSAIPVNPPTNVIPNPTGVAIDIVRVFSRVHLYSDIPTDANDMDLVIFRASDLSLVGGVAMEAMEATDGSNRIVTAILDFDWGAGGGHFRLAADDALITQVWTFTQPPGQKVRLGIFAAVIYSK